MTRVTLLKGIVGDVKGHIVSFHGFTCMQTYSELTVRTHVANLTQAE